MKELPVLVLLKILDHLPTLDAIRYRAVCKSWRDTIDQFFPDELNVFYGQRQYMKYIQFRKCFMDPNRSISFSETSLKRLVFGNEKFAFLFRNLKKFSLEQYIIPSYDYRELNQLINSFVNLEHLYLVGTSLISIKLAKLKTYDCSFYNVSRDAQGGIKVVDCPELQALAIDWVEEEAPVLNCPKLQYLKYMHYSPWVSRLDSLEVLNLWKLEKEDILSNHPNLHTINVFSVQKAVLSELVRSGRELERDHLKIFVRSLPVDDELLEAFDEVFNRGAWSAFRSLAYFTKKGVEFYAKHEQEFRDDFFVFDEYDSIIVCRETFANLKLLTDRSAIFRKIRRVHRLEIQVSGWIDFCSQKELINLLKQIPNTQVFTYSGVALDQAFFDQLPTILDSLYSLIIWNHLTSLSDLSFVLRFRELRHILLVGQNSNEAKRILNEFEKKKALDFDFKHGAD